MSYQSIYRGFHKEAGMRKEALTSKGKAVEFALKGLGKLTGLVKNKKFDLSKFHAGYHGYNFVPQMFTPEYKLGRLLAGKKDNKVLASIMRPEAYNDILGRFYAKDYSPSFSVLDGNFLSKLNNELRNSGNPVNNALARLQRAFWNRAGKGWDKSLERMINQAAGKREMMRMLRAKSTKGSIEDINKLLEQIKNSYV